MQAQSWLIFATEPCSSLPGAGSMPLYWNFSRGHGAELVEDGLVRGRHARRRPERGGDALVLHQRPAPNPERFRGADRPIDRPHAKVVGEPVGDLVFDEPPIRAEPASQIDVVSKARGEERDLHDAVEVGDGHRDDAELREEPRREPLRGLRSGVPGAEDGRPGVEGALLAGDGERRRDRALRVHDRLDEVRDDFLKELPPTGACYIKIECNIIKSSELHKKNSKRKDQTLRS